MKQNAGCSCGQLSISYDGQVAKTSICHCLECQKRTGSVFGVQSRLDRTKISAEGISTIFRRTGDDGGIATFHFCPTCGSTVFWEIDQMPGSVIVAAGAFADPKLPAPTFSVYKARKHHWVEIPSSVVDDLD